MQTRLHIRKNDHVLVLSGKDKGKTGVILEMLPHKRRATVEGVHMIKKHTRPNPQAPQGGIVEREGTINIANLKLICPKCNIRPLEQSVAPLRRKLESGQKDTMHVYAENVVSLLNATS